MLGLQDIQDLMTVLQDATIKGSQAERIAVLKKNLLDMAKELQVKPPVDTDE